LLGLTDPLVKLNIGQTAEIVAHRFGITRENLTRLAEEYGARFNPDIGWRTTRD
jgi:acetyl-CoA C-acetyltransferase